MRIAILDDYHAFARRTLPAALWSAAEITEFPETLPPGDEAGLIARLRPFEVVSTMRERTLLPRSVIEQLPNLRIILTTGERNLGIDTVACRERGVVVAGTPYPPMRNGGTVQHTWALILALACNIPRDDALIGSGGWGGAVPLSTYLTGATLGIAGLGRLGRQVARLGLAFGMDVIAWSANLTQELADDAARDMGVAAGSFRVVTKDELFARADVLSLHLLLSSRTRGIVTAADLARMKPTALLVNTARGPLVDEPALLDTLERGAIRGAALDVFDEEPLPPTSPWRSTQWGHDRRAQVILTPHTAYAFEGMLGHMWERTRENLERVVNGDEPLWRIV